MMGEPPKNKLFGKISENSRDFCALLLLPELLPQMSMLGTHVF